ncbi:PhzF family phenazine biosynthesis protein [Chitinilyticum litopenaei]|uniref:PhzF family phenazine biosynthesis protein n=1 Tax=Chitinilyticum litopenaei TaxID=1121276 RepID=UPI0004192597|nr:PhzF family phenazine biosynthesis protein [Chitinilyticum litopenaei]
MPACSYHLLNVFAPSHFSGNPLAVFPDARGLDDGTMQAIARQLNLSETTFVTPSASATARVRIFTPEYEMPFAGHPTLGTAWLVNRLKHCNGRVTLELPAGIIPVTLDDAGATLTANPPSWRPGPARADFAAALGLSSADLAGDPLFVDTGTEQLIVPLADAGLLARLKPDLPRFAELSRNRQGHNQAFCWAPAEPAWLARFLWVQQGQLAEDFGTGSACANLGGWLLQAGQSLPFATNIIQGHLTDRQALIGLAIDAGQRIQVSGQVRQVGSGELLLP